MKSTEFYMKIFFIEIFIFENLPNFGEISEKFKVCLKKTQNMNLHESIWTVCDQKELFIGIFETLEKWFQLWIGLDVIVDVLCDNFMHYRMACAH